MKKSTLLAFAALLGGTAMGFAQDVIELPGGLKASTAENPIYYRISNMRAQRLSWITGEVVDKEGEAIAEDNWANGALPPYLPDGESETPEIWDRPYMGLALVDNTFWCGFSGQNEVIDEATTYWWFEIASATKKSVYIHNAVISGALKNRSENIMMNIDGVNTNLTPGNQQGGTSFSETAKQAWYVLPITEELQEEYLEGIDEYFDMENAFGLSKDATLVTDGTVNMGGPDVSNYIVQSYQKNAEGGWLGPWCDEDGEPIEVDLTEEQLEDPEVTSQYWYDETAEIYCKPAKYGFATLRICWSPLAHNGTNDNHLYNNGSLFTVEEVTDLEAVQAAMDKYKEIEIKANQAKAAQAYEAAKVEAINELRTLSNLPAIYDQTEIEGIIAAVQALQVDASNVKTAADVDAIEAKAAADFAPYISHARNRAGDGTVITLQQMLNVLDWQDFDDTEEPYICNAYLSSDGLGFIWANGAEDNIDYPSVTVLPEVNESCKWTMEYANGGYRLKNNGKYIRVYGNWDTLVDWAEYGYETEEDEETGVTPSVSTLFEIATWALTEDPEEAAVFSFTGFAEDFQDWTFSDQVQTIIEENYETLGYADEAAVQTTTNIAHLTAPAPQVTNATPNGISYLRRDDVTKNYMINSWNKDMDRFFAAGSCWKIEKVAAGEVIEDGISEIAAAPAAQGIYDMQGRKVAKAAKGLYIINGVKTLVK